MANARSRGLNPLLVHSLRQFTRARRKLGQRPLGQAIVLGAAAVAYAVSVYAWWRMLDGGDQEAFIAVACFLMAGLGVMVPGLSAGVFAQERQNGSLDLLLTCPLTNRELVRGKVLGQFLGPLSICALALPFLILAPAADKAVELWGATLALVPAEVAALVCLGVYCSARCRTAAGARGMAIGIALGLGMLVPMLDAAYANLRHNYDLTIGLVVCPPASFLTMVERDTSSPSFLAYYCPVFLLACAFWFFALLENRFDKLVRFAEHRRSANA